MESVTLLRKRPYSAFSASKDAGIQQTHKQFLRKTKQGRVLKGEFRHCQPADIANTRLQLSASTICARTSPVARFCAKSASRCTMR
jgi:hypothetical protein